MFVNKGIVFQNLNSSQSLIAQFTQVEKFKGDSMNTGATAAHYLTRYLTQQPMVLSGIVSQGARKACWERKYIFYKRYIYHLGKTDFQVIETLFWLQMGPTKLKHSLLCLRSLC